jgi:hypothetical protein
MAANPLATRGLDRLHDPASTELLGQGMAAWADPGPVSC